MNSLYMSNKTEFFSLLLSSNLLQCELNNGSLLESMTFFWSDNWRQNRSCFFFFFSRHNLWKSVTTLEWPPFTSPIGKSQYKTHRDGGHLPLRKHSRMLWLSDTQTWKKTKWTATVQPSGATAEPSNCTYLQTTDALGQKGPNSFLTCVIRLWDRITGYHWLSFTHMHT